MATKKGPIEKGYRVMGKSRVSYTVGVYDTHTQITYKEGDIIKHTLVPEMDKPSVHVRVWIFSLTIH